MPVYRVAGKSILRSFQNSKKRHLLITGSRGIGKSTLLKEILSCLGFSRDFPGFFTHAVPKTRVEIQDSFSKKSGIIGTFSSSQMEPCLDGFLEIGIPAVLHAASISIEEAPFAVIDEIGYLEMSCQPFLDALISLFDARPVIAVIRKQSLPFLDSLKARPDVLVIDLDRPVVPIGCVIMASGLGKRFGSDKLMTSFQGKPLISQILQTTDSSLFAARIVVTRSKAVQDFCESSGISVLFHEFPDRNDTVRLGLSALLEAHPDLQGCIFVLGDQPLLSHETLETMALSFSAEAESHEKKEQAIFRLFFQNEIGSPVLFPNQFFSELLHLPKGKGGSFILKNHPESVRLISARNSWELMDIDTPEDLKLLLDYIRIHPAD